MGLSVAFFMYPMMQDESLNTTPEQEVIGWHQLLDIIHSINAVRGSYNVGKPQGYGLGSVLKKGLKSGPTRTALP